MAVSAYFAWVRRLHISCFMEAYESIDVLARVLNPPCSERFHGRAAVASAGMLEVEFGQFIQPWTLLQVKGKNGYFLGEVLSCSPSAQAVNAFSTVVRVQDYCAWRAPVSGITDGRLNDGRSEDFCNTDVKDQR
jgi:hypothetical protein